MNSMDDILYRKLNNYIGWGLFAFATLMFMMTLEPTVSFWDVGERISVSYKLQIGHPPGAPFYQMLARMFSLFALGDTARVAFWVNGMSAVAGGLTIMFLFWTITILARKLIDRAAEMTPVRAMMIFGSGIVGALTLTFSDSFWFTAVEAEVYVTSAFLTAFVFWAILQWEARAHEKDAHKWLVLIFFIIGLSIGVHLLNLLAIPAIVFVYYFKKYEPTTKGILFTGLFAVGMLYFIQNILIPGLLNMDWQFERFFVNTLGLPFHSGTIIYFILLISALAWALYYTQKKKRVVWNTIFLCITFIVIGYSSFFMLVIRSNAEVPINENAPKDALAMKAYLGREQYGDWPLVHGPYYNAPVVDMEDGRPVWGKNRETGRYEIINPRKGLEPVYDPQFTTLFPRMHSSRPQHVQGYEDWGNVRGRPVTTTRHDGTTETVNRPTFGENLRFFFSYQVGHMYVRYLMWNFSGRQNDIQGHGSPVEGNWITGIPFIDNLRLGPQDLPESMTSNPGYNRYYMLPFLLGVLGFLYQLKRRPNDTLIVGLLFFMTGLAIIIYLNQTPFQPRERDYSYIGSFYAFSIWVGIGVLGLADGILRKLKERKVNLGRKEGLGVVAAVTALCLLVVPVNMAKENWDDHDRSGRYTARDVAVNYLETCAPDAIIFTNGDNDTFPLWYAQEVEGVRPDIKVVNMSLFNTDWYIDNMLRRKTYEADPLPFSFTPRQYRDGTRDYIYVIERLEGYQSVRRLMEFVRDDTDRTRIRTGRGLEDYMPTNQFRLPVDSAKVVDNGTVAPEDAHLIADAVEWELPVEGLNKNHMMALDFLAENNWERPVYFAITTGSESYMGLEDYFQLDGMAYRLVPIQTESDPNEPGRINTGILYDKLMNTFEWGNMNDPSVYLNEDHRRITVSYRNLFQRLAAALLDEGQDEQAIAVLDRAMEVMPEYNVPYNYFTFLIAENYYRAGAHDKANEIALRLIDLHDENLAYFFSFRGGRASMVEGEIQESLAMIQRIAQVADEYGQEELAERSGRLFDTYYDRWSGGF
ncbi:MAG: protein O-mannosyl-transferase family [Bacteroidales bacterium]